MFASLKLLSKIIFSLLRLTETELLEINFFIKFQRKKKLSRLFKTVLKSKNIKLVKREHWTVRLLMFITLFFTLFWTVCLVLSIAPQENGFDFVFSPDFYCLTRKLPQVGSLG